jgi:hypothetical protein
MMRRDGDDEFLEKEVEKRNCPADAAALAVALALTRKNYMVDRIRRFFSKNVQKQKTKIYIYI